MCRWTWGRIPILPRARQDWNPNPLPRRHAAVDADRLSRDERRLLAGEIDDGVGDIFRHAPALHRNQLEVGVLLGLGIILMAFDGNPAGRDTVHRDAERRQFGGHTARPADLTALRRNIAAEVADAALKDFAGDVDDPAPFLFLHLSQTALGQEKRALDEEVDHPLIELPVVLLNRLERLRARRVGHDNVRAAELGFRLAIKRVDAFRRSHIRANEDALAARGAELIERPRAARLVVVVVEDNLRA